MAGRQPYNDGLGPVFEVIGGKWKGLILWELNERPVRFGELRRRVAGVSEKMLIQQLREMEADKLVHRELFPQVPPRVEYSLTALGASLTEALTPLCEWGKEHLKDRDGSDGRLEVRRLPAARRRGETP